jgi:glutamate/tyrosine decarboxylase-like PLP-dependent enzyme
MVREETLDPENWDETKALGHKMLDDMFEHIKKSKTEPWRFVTGEQTASVLVPLTANGEGEKAVYDAFVKDILPSMIGPKTARFWGYVVGGGSPYGMLADMLTSGTNMPADSAFSAAFNVNKQALNWIKEMLDYPLSASGTFGSGGSEANFTGLAVARNARAEVDIKTKGVQGAPKKMTLYVSDQGHDCLDRSIELLGLGTDALKHIPTDENCKIRLDLLEKAIQEDRKNGSNPFCIIGCAGTVNSGAFDDFNALADLSEREKMWLHVDGAFGGWVKLSKTHRKPSNGMERADSLAIDLHKWMDMPYGIGCTLVRNPRDHIKTFVYGHEAAYLKTAMDAFEDQYHTANLGLRFSNQILALKVYMLLRAYGREKYSRLIQQNIEQINYLANRIKKESNLEVTVPVESNICCFRYNPGGLDESQLEKLNKAILDGLWKLSAFVVSDTTIKGKYMLRACNVNHRSSYEDFDWLVDEVKKLGEQCSPKIK